MERKEQGSLCESLLFREKKKQKGKNEKKGKKEKKIKCLLHLYFILNLVQNSLLWEKNTGA